MLKKILLFIFVLTVFSCKKNEAVKPIFKETEKAVVSKKEKQPDINIFGTYRVVNDDNYTDTCSITLVIDKEATGYTYHLKTDNRNVKGRATYSFSEKSKEAYITLEGIDWDEYEGDISHQDEEGYTVHETEIVMTGIDGAIVNDTITIQNYGNAMNSYIKLSECVHKYIRLAKQQLRESKILSN